MNKRQRKKWLKQHKAYVDPKETWSLDVTLAQYIYPRLLAFKKLSNGHPTCLTIDEWNGVLDKMIFAFKELAEDRLIIEVQMLDRIKEGLDLFVEYYRALWW